MLAPDIALWRRLEGLYFYKAPGSKYYFGLPKEVVIATLLTFHLLLSKFNQPFTIWIMDSSRPRDNRGERVVSPWLVSCRGTLALAGQLSLYMHMYKHFSSALLHGDCYMPPTFRI